MSDKADRAEYLRKIKEMLADYKGRHVVILWDEDGSGAMASVIGPLGQMAQVVGRTFASALLKAGNDANMTPDEFDQLVAKVHEYVGSSMVGLRTRLADAQPVSTPLSGGFVFNGSGNA
jgi:hypothetical protein